MAHLKISQPKTSEQFRLQNRVTLSWSAIGGHTVDKNDKCVKVHQNSDNFDAEYILHSSLPVDFVVNSFLYSKATIRLYLLKLLFHSLPKWLRRNHNRSQMDVTAAVPRRVLSFICRLCTSFHKVFLFTGFCLAYFHLLS